MDKPPIRYLPSRHKRYLQFLYNKGRVSPLDAPPLKSPSKPAEYKTIREESAEYKAQMRAARAKQEANKRAKPLHPCRAPLHPCRAPLHPCRAPLHPRESPLHKEPSKFSGVFAEWWGHRVELMKYHFAVLKRKFIPTLFCLRAEVDDQE